MKYEYRFLEKEGTHYTSPAVFQMNDYDLEEFTASINRLGEEGWELVNVVPCAYSSQGTYKLAAFLKREC